MGFDDCHKNIIICIHITIRSSPRHSSESSFVARTEDGVVDSDRLRACAEQSSIMLINNIH